MKNFLLNRIVIVVVAFSFGGISVWGLTRYMDHQKSKNETSFLRPSLPTETQKFFKNFFNDDFFSESQDPFAEMRRIQRQMQEQFVQTPTHEIKQREDDQFLYYEIDLHKQSPKEVKVDVKDGQVFISGQIESKENEDGSSRYYSSTFNRSFPVPEGTDGNNYTLEKEGQNIVIKFPKIKT